ncbi:SDR family NAD(P)-dependent oxidoreductase [Flavobacterium circumlabens]|uniref:NADP-dependent 3-hydroxy acid dehydrogenase YdfG n=1 Tax=Flavobacterium circumlabens TaxID=2133765 RepID=A0A4Y7UAU7_9FLAO|nr:oxidoreductase [Flavobacterium circumlabens]TCN56545.1 NADP-dependent 3-hydroxy acid dehydrogenase YdfG [Flavobacterium circumlabens]TEB43563.1 SDR family NAD(P)-dependent oxidoreductase [Flavobacterium circumlabens]
MKNENKTWFITGTSQGIGLILVKQLLKQGYNVAATARNAETLKKAVGSSSLQFLPLQVDLVDEKSVKQAVETTVAQFGSIDYLVNNAGYGLIGGIEESSDAEVRANFDVNVFGLLNVTRAILPYMRQKKLGHIINISSVFGLLAGAGWGIYCSTKFAVEAISEALVQEVKPFGIKVTLIEPGYVRTNFLNSSSLIASKNPISDYTEIREAVRTHQEDLGGKQLGDPEKVAALIQQITTLEAPPLHLLTGSDAYQFANYKIDSLKNEIEANKERTFSTDFTA